MAVIDYASLKKGGFMRQKQKGYFSLRLAVVGGNLTAENIRTIAEVAEKYGHGYVHMTSRQGVEIPFIHFDQIEEVRAELAKGEKSQGDPALRACFEEPVENELTAYISRLAAVKKSHPALNYGTFDSVLMTNRQCIFERRSEEERILVAVNADDQPFVAHFNAGCGLADELLTGTVHDFGGGSELAPLTAYFWKMER